MAYSSEIVHFSLLGERLFSRSRPRGTQGARVPTQLQFDLRRRSVLQALVGQSRAALTLCPGMGAAPSRPTRVLETRIYVFFNAFLFFFLLAATAAVQQCNNSNRRTAAAALEGFLLRLWQPSAAVSHTQIAPSKLLISGSHGTTAAAHKAFPSMTATNGASGCVRVRVRVI